MVRFCWRLGEREGALGLHVHTRYLCLEPPYWFINMVCLCWCLVESCVCAHVHVYHEHVLEPTYWFANMVCLSWYLGESGLCVCTHAFTCVPWLSWRPHIGVCGCVCDAGSMLNGRTIRQNQRIPSLRQDREKEETHAASAGRRDRKREKNK